MDIVRICGGDYTQYEALLLRRDSLKKEAMDYLNDYIRVFGELTMAVYEQQIECIKLKKAIAFCQTAANYGRKPDREQLGAFLQQEMAEYYQKLRQMADNNQAFKDAEAVPEHDVLRIKKIYRDIAKKLHPDISPMTGKYPELLELWYRLVTAYNCNSLQEAEEVQMLINSFLERSGEDHFEITIPNINRKIAALEAEIKQIITTTPYTYKELLNDLSAVETKKETLREELETYRDYAAELQEILDQLC